MKLDPTILLKRTLLAAVVVAAAYAFAADPVNKDRDGVAIEGYDPVAYFTMDKPVKGSEQFVHRWQGAEWRFANQEHLDLFKANPEKYAPQYGGYCAYAVSKNSTASIDPDSWKIVDGKLYLNYSKRIQRRWEKDIPGYIAKADKNWPGLIDK